MKPLCIRPTRKRARSRLSPASERPSPRPNLFEKERKVEPTKSTAITEKPSPRRIARVAAFVNLPLIQYRTRRWTVVHGPESFTTCPLAQADSSVSFRKTSSSLASLPASASFLSVWRSPTAIIEPLSIMAIWVA